MTDTLTTAIHTYLSAAPTGLFNGREVTLVQAWAGADNLLWRVQADDQDAVLKLFLDAGQARSRRQFAGQECFAPLGLAPQPLWVDRYPAGLAHQALVYAWAEGTAPDPTASSDAELLAEAVAIIHSYMPETMPRVSPHPVNLAYLQRLLASSISSIDLWLSQAGAPALQQAFGRTAGVAMSRMHQAQPLWANARPGLIHGDLTLEHVIMTGRGPVLLDWEMFGLGDPALEIGGFLLQSRSVFSDEQQAHWLTRYLARMAQPGLEQRIAAARAVLPFRHLCRLLDGVRQSDEPGEIDAETRLAIADLINRTWQASDAALDLDVNDLNANLNTIMARM
ncbi:MAG: phosphotransferase [Caldilineaceae bacterium]|nr:phosphotransferase [Caldilineaceae bacterium]